jgi:UDP-N-acetylmuramoylalanine--D-glutamate ligase
MGGRDKGSNFAILKDRVRRHVKKLILLGEASGDIGSALKETVGSETVPSMESAVAAAARSVRSGETVLLSPGCASFDMFSSYAERGEAFRKAVNRLR